MGYGSKRLLEKELRVVLAGRAARTAIISIGVRFLYDPLAAAADFGVPVDGSQNPAYLWAKGTRDIVSGLLGFALLWLGVSRRVLSVFLAVVALVPLGDLINVYVSVDSNNVVALAIHAGTALFILGLAMCLWKESRANALLN